MADYTVIVDDSDSQFTYGPSQDSWATLHADSTYQKTIHHTKANDANLSFSFIGGREILIRGQFIGHTNASNCITYPMFQVDSNNTFHCSPDTPQSGAEFLCSASLPATIANHTLTVCAKPHSSTPQYHIDYIRHGSNSGAAATANGAPIYVKAPDNTTLGLSFQGDWQYQSIGGTNDIKNAMYTSTASSTAIYQFAGNSFAWWGCCMPAGTPSDTANVTYRVDGGDVISARLDKSFTQSVQCYDEKILFQIQPDTLNNNTHTLEVVYNGDDTKMPLTLCALGATPLDLNVLDVQPLSFNASFTPHSSSSVLPPSATPSRSPLTGNNDRGKSAHQKLHRGIIAGVICGGVAALIVLFVGVIWWKRKRAKQQRQERRSSSTDSLSPLPLYPVFGFLDAEKGSSTVLAPPTVDVEGSTGVSTLPLNSNEQDRNSVTQSTDSRLSSSQLESRPPSYRTGRSLPDFR